MCVCVVLRLHVGPAAQNQIVRRECHCGLSHSPYVNIRSVFCSPTPFNTGCRPSRPSSAVPSTQTRHGAAAAVCRSPADAERPHEKCKKPEESLVSRHLTHRFSHQRRRFRSQRGGKKKTSACQMFPEKLLILLRWWLRIMSHISH